jgi:flagellar hook-length control protein FliK
MIMQNLTLPTSQTLALGATLNAKDSLKSSAHNNQSSIEQNSSFEMMLKKQVKAQNETVKDKTNQQQAAQKNANQKNTVDQKKSQLKTEQNDNNVAPTEQEDDQALEVNDSIAQMLVDAKALFAGNKTEGVSSDNASFDQGSSTENTLFSIAPNIAPIVTNTAINNDEVDLSTTSLKDSLQESNSAELKDSLLSKSTQVKSSDLVEDNHSLALDGKESSQDRLLWAAVSTSKASQNLNQGTELANSKLVESAKFSDISSNLNLSTPQASQANQISTILGSQQLGSSSQINAYPGKTGWDQAISQKVVWMVGAAEQTATLSLNPPDLGPLQVVINVSNNMADTTFISNNAEVRQALQDGMANLREKMAESGIQLGQANVNSGGRPQQEFSSASFNSDSSRLSEVDANSSLPSITQTTRIVQVNNGLVDTFA